MDANELPAGVTALVDDISALAEVESVILFGSRAKNSARPRSDVDLAIEAPRAGPLAWDHICELAESAETLLVIDLVRLDEASAEFRDEILKEGHALYVRSNDRA